MNIFDIISKRRSIRQYKKEGTISDEQVKKIVEAGLAAPTAGNGQCWRFFVVRNAEIKKKLALEAGHQKFIDDCPVVIVVCADLEKEEQNYGARGRDTYALQDTAAAVENMLLAITALGYGSCWIGAFNESVAADILNLPKNLRPVAMVPVGIPLKDEVPAPPHKKFEDVVEFVV